MFPFGLLSGEVVRIAGATREYAPENPSPGDPAYNTLYISAGNFPASGLLKGYVMWQGRKFSEGNAYEIIESWVWGTNFTKDYWMRVTLTAGDAPSGSSTGIWMPFTPTGNQSQFYRWQTSDLTSVEGTVLLEISDDSEGASILSSASYTMGIAPVAP